MLLDPLASVRRAKEWALSAPSYGGEFSFGAPGSGRLVLGVFGDSVGCGLGVTSLERTFAGKVAARLAGDGGVLCRIHAVSGSRAADLAGQPPSGDERYAVVSIGTNDLLNGDSMSEIERSLCAFLETLRSVERVVVMGPGDLSAVLITPALLRPLVRPRVLACEAAIKRAAARFANASHLGFGTIGMAPTPEHFAPDGFHPSEDAHALIAEAVLSLLPGRLQ